LIEEGVFLLLCVGVDGFFTGLHGKYKQVYNYKKSIGFSTEEEVCVQYYKKLLSILPETSPSSQPMH